MPGRKKSRAVMAAIARKADARAATAAAKAPAAKSPAAKKSPKASPKAAATTSPKAKAASPKGGKALIVGTSANVMGASKHATGAWLEEIAGPYYVFLDANFAVDLGSSKGGKIPLDAASLADGALTEPCKRFQGDKAASAKLEKSLKLTEDLVKGYDVVFFAGGHGTYTDFPGLGSIVSAAYAANKVVASVCHGPTVFAEAKNAKGEPLVKGKKVTGFSNEEEKMVGLTEKVPFLLETKLKALGGKYSNGPAWGSFVVADGKLLTGQNPGSSVELAKAALAAL